MGARDLTRVHVDLTCCCVVVVVVAVAVVVVVVVKSSAAAAAAAGAFVASSEVVAVLFVCEGDVGGAETDAEFAVCLLLLCDSALRAWCLRLSQLDVDRLLEAAVSLHVTLGRSGEIRGRVGTEVCVPSPHQL